MKNDPMNKLISLSLSDPHAQDIMAKLCVPSATGASGAQLGVEKPWKQKFPSSKGKKPISSDEAIRRYREKLASDAPAYPVEQANAQIGGSDPEDLDPFTDDADGVPSSPRREAVEEAAEAPEKARKPRRTRQDKVDASLGEALLAALANIASAGKEAAKRPEPVPEKPVPSVLSEYKARKEVVRMKLSTGQVTMPCLSVVQEEYSVTIVMDADANGFMFVPESGSEVTIAWKGRTVKAYYPGAQFTIPELGITGLVFLADPNQTSSTETSSRIVAGDVRVESGSSSTAVPPPPPESKFTFNPESGMEEDEFGLTRV